ncbi:TetR/AcrR family transcriptional regulator [Gordonia sp. SL306]|uniref:TetR/AcrR family transcriptional regulator n=1 Tax=Gordonia sp. SL306 TaxID=2995145 RepID=UPI0022710A89|nr:TetR/AcrR family transcriptional regulator [Gordonia sp. SL306]WAC55550.1 TetR/AcrR family transcriptional regulator [Gordonia sp. SL306]
MNNENVPSTPERILAAAAAIINEEGLGARLSVRTVAARAGVSTGSLRHHFPTQQDLRDEVMHRIYDWIAPADNIHDTSIPARDRLVHCLQQVLGLIGSGPNARSSMVDMVRTFIDGEQTDQTREAYLAIENDSQRRIEAWLKIVADEGTLSQEVIPDHARFLYTVVNGLGLERALPAEDSIANRELTTLYIAVDSVLDT